MQGFEDATLQAQLWTHEVQISPEANLGPYQADRGADPCHDPRDAC